jgi:hypothetical protein
MLNSLYRPVLIHGQLVSSSARQNPQVRSPLNNEAYEETANSVANNSRNQARASSRDRGIFCDLEVYGDTEHDLEDVRYNIGPE